MTATRTYGIVVIILGAILLWFSFSEMGLRRIRPGSPCLTSMILKENGRRAESF